MDSLIQRVDAWVIALGFAIAMFTCWTVGWRRGRRFPLVPGEDPGTKFIDAGLALLGLLLAFTFSMSLGRHDQRRLAEVAESNAIGDFYTCASLLKEPHRSRLQNVIHEYARLRMDAQYSTSLEARENQATQRCLEMYARMTSIVDEAISEGAPIVVPLVNTLNNLPSSSALTVAAYRERLPWSIVILLLLSSVVPSFLIGEKQGASQTMRLAGTFSFIVLVTLVIFVTLDLNQPRSGLIKVSQDSLERVVQSMAR